VVRERSGGFSPAIVGEGPREIREEEGHIINNTTVVQYCVQCCNTVQQLLYSLLYSRRSWRDECVAIFRAWLNA